MAPPRVHKEESPHEQAVLDKLRQRDDAIPLLWRLPQRLMSNLKVPLESSKNNLIEMDFPRQSGIMTEEELHITESYDVTGLLQALASGELTCESVAVAFCKRAAIAHQLVSFIPGGADTLCNIFVADDQCYRYAVDKLPDGNLLPKSNMEGPAARPDARERSYPGPTARLAHQPQGFLPGIWRPSDTRLCLLLGPCFH